MKNRVTVMLDNIRSAHNVGSIFRTADGAGVEKLYLIGTTPAPVDRFGRTVAEIEKTSLGAANMVPWEYVENGSVIEVVAKLKAEGFVIVVVEQTSSSILLDDFSPPENACYVFGNEVEGVGEELLKLADQVVEIPMKGQKESLNVSVAAGVVLFNRAN